MPFNFVAIRLMFSLVFLESDNRNRVSRPYPNRFQYTFHQAFVNLARTLDFPYRVNGPLNVTNYSCIILWNYLDSIFWYFCTFFAGRLSDLFQHDALKFVPNYIHRLFIAISWLQPPLHWLSLSLKGSKFFYMDFWQFSKIESTKALKVVNS